MTTLVTLTVNQAVVLVECDGLSRDLAVPTNILMVGCKRVTADGLTDVKMWSVPASWVISYVCGVKEVTPE